jgi:hypothetical protein
LVASRKAISPYSFSRFSHNAQVGELNALFDCLAEVESIKDGNRQRALQLEKVTIFTK